MSHLNEVFDLLREDRRRYALYYLERADGKVPIEELARRIREWEEDPSSYELPRDESEEVRILLEHTDLPKIEEADSIEYRRENDEIAIYDAASEFEIVLSVARAIEEPADLIDVDSIENFT